MRANGGSYCMKIKQLSVHTRAVSELCGCRVLTKGPIIGQPNTAAKMLMRTKDKKLVLQKIPPVVRKVRHQDEGQDPKRFGSGSDMLNSLMWFLRLQHQRHTIIEEKLRLGFTGLQATDRPDQCTCWPQSETQALPELEKCQVQQQTVDQPWPKQQVSASSPQLRYSRHKTTRQGNWPQVKGQAKQGQWKSTRTTAHFQKKWKKAYLQMVEQQSLLVLR